MVKVVTKRREEFMDIGWQDFADEQELKMFIDFNLVLGVDTETTGMSFMDEELLSVQIGNQDKQFVIDAHTVDVSPLKTQLEDKLLLFQNAVFDLPFLYDLNIIPEFIWDTLLAEKVLSLGVLNYKRDLGTLVERYCGEKIDKSKQKEIHKTGILDLGSIKYAANDVKYLIPIMEAQKRLAEKRGNKRAIDLENKFVRVLAYTEYCGIYQDDKAWYDIVRKNEYYEYGAWLKLCEFVNNNTDLKAEDINWNSPPQVVELFKKFGINTYDKKERKDTVNKDFLKKQSDHPLIDLYIEYKKKSKQVSTYGREWFDYAYDDGRIHTKFKQLVRTGRMACGNISKGPFPNLQNITQDAEMRACFKGQGPNMLITCDYSGQENVIMADKSKEPKLLEFYKSGGGDGHSYTAKLIWNRELKDVPLSEIKEKHPDKRQKSKSVSFAVAFGGSGYTVAENLNISKDEGERIYNAFMKAYPELKNYFDATFADAMKHGYILINEVTGLKRYIEGMREYLKRGKKNERFEGQIYRLSLNTPVQATAAQITKTAGIYFFDWILKNKRFGKTKIVNIVHDEYVVEEHQFKAEDTAKVLQECMEKAGRVFLDELELKAEPEIDKVWKK